MSALRSTVSSLFSSSGADGHQGDRSSTTTAHCASPSHVVLATSAPSLVVLPLSRARPAPARTLALGAPVVSMALLDSALVASLDSNTLVLVDAATLAYSSHGGFASGHVAMPRRDLDNDKLDPPPRVNGMADVFQDPPHHPPG